MLMHIVVRTVGWCVVPGACRGDDWLELANIGASDVDIAGSVTLRVAHLCLCLPFVWYCDLPLPPAAPLARHVRTTCTPTQLELYSSREDLVYNKPNNTRLTSTRALPALVDAPLRYAAVLLIPPGLHHPCSAPNSPHHRYSVHDDKGKDDKGAFTFPAASPKVIKGGEFLGMCAQLQDGTGPSFKIGGDDTIYLLDAAGKQVSTSGALPGIGEDDKTYSLHPDGTYKQTSTPTFGKVQHLGASVSRVFRLCIPHVLFYGGVPFSQATCSVQIP